MSPARFAFQSREMFRTIALTGLAALVVATAISRPPPGQGVPPPGSVQSQPLAPPPGTTVIPQNTQPGVAVAPPQPNQGVVSVPPGATPLPGLSPGQRQP